MAAQSDEYLAVLKASYSYDPQSNDEIAIKEDQLLLLKERVDEDWWKVKIKIDAQEEDSPEGLVPAAYVEPAVHTSTVRAIYDYEPSAPGELAIQESEILLVFDTEQDWLLVQSQKEGGKAGFVPGNYVEAYNDESSPPAPQIIVPPSATRPVSTYVDPADRVASTKVTADGIQTWSVSEIDKKGKKKKGTLGVGNGAVFFASEADKTPVQKWQTADVENINSEKSKHISIDVRGANPVNLHFHAGSKDNVDAIMAKLKSSKALSGLSDASRPSSSDILPSPSAENHSSAKAIKKPSVHFSHESPDIIPRRGEEDYEEEELAEDQDIALSNTPATNGKRELGTALYDFTADGDDELSITEGEQLIILERHGDEWWKCRNSQGMEGVVPGSYIEVLASSETSKAPSVSDEEGEEEERLTQERLAQESRLRVEAQRREREQAAERAEKAQKKLEAQQRANEAAAAEADRKKRQEATAQRSPLPPSEISGRKSVENGAVSSSSRTSSENNRPPPDRTRIWHDRSGQFRVEAAFLGFVNGKLRLHKVNGVIVEVPSEKMSIEDMQYVEKLTSKRSRPPSKQVSDDDMPLGLSRESAASKTNASRAASPKKASKIDWFDFFLSAGCDLDDCTRYAASFERDKIDETILPDITDATMRSLGLREGDIIRVTKAIEKRRPTDNLKKPNVYTDDQVGRDEELAKQLQAQDSGGSARSPAPNLFSGPGGILKNPRRGRPQPSKSLPPSNVDLKAISTVSDQISRTASPGMSSPGSAHPSLTPVQPPARSSSAVPVASGFDDDAWTNRPSSTNPLVGTPPLTTPRAPSAPPATAPTAPQVTSSTAPAVQPSPAPVPSATPPRSSPASLTKTTESDIFNQLSRLSELRNQNTLSQPPAPPISHSAPPPSNQNISVPPAPLAQFTQTRQAIAPSQMLSQSYNGPRGPFAPVPANQGLLQPLIPTQTGFNNFISTRPAFISSFSGPQPQSSFLAPQPTGILNTQPLISQPQPSFLASQPTGLFNTQLNTQSLISQPTGIPSGNFNPVPYQNPFNPVQTQFTGFNPNVNQSLSLSNAALSVLPRVPPLPPVSNPPLQLAPNTSPANVFAQMKSGTFAADDNDSRAQPAEKYRPSPLATQATGWGQPFQGGNMGYQR